MKYTVDNLMADSKGAFDFVSEKASQAVSLSKSYVERAQIKLKLRDKYCELGKLCYSMHKNDTDESGSMKKLIKDISILETELEYADEACKKPRVCPSCGAMNDSENTFCSKCGERL